MSYYLKFRIELKLSSVSKVNSNTGKCQKFSFRGGGFWRVAKTGSRRCTPVTFGRQPAQVFSRPRRRTQSVLTQRRNFWLERL